LEKFHLLHRYWEGERTQFACRVYLLEAESRTLPLCEAGAEGLPLWMALEDGRAVLKEPFNG
jgi:hypothetical protein